MLAIAGLTAYVLQRGVDKKRGRCREWVSRCSGLPLPCVQHAAASTSTKGRLSLRRKDGKLSASIGGFVRWCDLWLMRPIGQNKCVSGYRRNWPRFKIISGWVLIWGGLLAVGPAARIGCREQCRFASLVAYCWLTSDSAYNLRSAVSRFYARIPLSSNTSKATLRSG
jgi:hypothetical protein